jgi:hypothetical protein
VSDVDGEDEFDDEEDPPLEQFHRSVAEYESRELGSLFDLLPKSGVSLPEPDELDDGQLTAKLWKVIYALAVYRVFLHQTDHLSDRELYTFLWKDQLQVPMVLMPENSDFSCHIDVLGSGSEEDTDLWLKYYADEVERQRWLEEWPQDPLPEPTKPLYSRAGRLPHSDTRDGNEIM